MQGEWFANRCLKGVDARELGAWLVKIPILDEEVVARILVKLEKRLILAPARLILVNEDDEIYTATGLDRTPRLHVNGRRCGLRLTLGAAVAGRRSPRPSLSFHHAINLQILTAAASWGEYLSDAWDCPESIGSH
jgi:hypothetical protein